MRFRAVNIEEALSVRNTARGAAGEDTPRVTIV